ncbi:MAG: hypothetical protein RLZZ631_17 [Cyanobacteriota bacterium]|jgi:hypothetical protein
MAELLATLTPRLQLQADQLLVEQQRQDHWHGGLPVALLDRCWLRLQVVPVDRLAAVLPPDTSGDAPELVRFRDLQQQGLPRLEAQERCWQEFGRRPCSEALQRFWQAQERGNHGWTLSAYLQLLERYRQQLQAEGPTPLPLLVLARSGSAEHHQLHWCWPVTPAIGHTCA